jgi:AGCS family alanine or glycine:cation symporter
MDRTHRSLVARAARQVLPVTALFLLLFGGLSSRPFVPTELSAQEINDRPGLPSDPGHGEENDEASLDETGVDTHDAESSPPEGSFAASIDRWFSRGVDLLASVLFIRIAGFPFIVLWLLCGAVFLTFRMKFINLRAGRHAFAVLSGRYDDSDAPGEVTHRQALSSALSATVGLGNIAGVAIAVQLGGPGALFWMIVAAFFGMTSKFVECTLGVKYRTIESDGKVLGGPIRYLRDGLQRRGLGGLGRVLAVVFMVFCIGGSFGGGNMFQANQATASLREFVGPSLPSWAVGLALMVAVGLVIVGGIQRIGRTAEAIVPLMCGMYLLAAGFVLVVNYAHVPDAMSMIVRMAFGSDAAYGGFIGVLIVGFQRAAFSNEAGIGSAAIAHSAAKTHEPVREGIVALVEPFIDTVVVCLATGLVIVTSGVLETSPDAEGAVLTARAFETVISWFPVLLTLAIVLFAYSTMISWSYYGERCWVGLFGPRSSLLYKALFLIAIFIGAVSNLGAVLDFSDLMILSMAFPNILGLYLLSGEVASDLDTYWRRYGND